jgi:anti-sigma regulatory factor (Ser/Thr protein kinase)
VTTVAATAPFGRAARPGLRLSALDLRPLPTAVPCARLHTRIALLAWRVPRAVADTAELIASELVTNACRVSAALDGPPPVGLRLSLESGRVLIEVWDAAVALPPEAQSAGLDDGPVAACGSSPPWPTSGAPGSPLTGAASSSTPNWRRRPHDTRPGQSGR